MTLPRSRNETYVDGTTQIPAATMNDIQDKIILLHGMLRGSGFHVRDDFPATIGGAVDTHKWVPGSGGTGVAPIIVDDSAAGGFGAVQFAAGASGGTSEALITKLAIGTKDLYVSCRVRRATAVGTSMHFTVGFIGDAGAADDLAFRGFMGGNWQRKLGATTTDDLGVAMSSTYQFLEMWRISGVVYFAIDGTTLYSGAFADDLGVGFFELRLFEGSAVANQINVDMVSVWVDR